MDETSELLLPHERFGEVRVQQILGVFEVPNEETDDQPDHRKVLAAIEEYGHNGGDRTADGDQLVARALQGLEGAEARIRANCVPPVPAPNVLISDVALRLACDPELDLQTDLYRMGATSDREASLRVGSSGYAPRD